MTGRMRDKHALVTAAGQGIGKATAEAFARAGASVLATDVNAYSLAAFSNCSAIEVAELDVTDRAAVDRLVSKSAPFDVLFNCAGTVHTGSILECSIEDWQTAFTLNVTSMFHLIRAVLPAMRARGGGVVVNVSSVAGFKGFPERCAYGMSKAAVIGLTKSVAADYVADGIRCNAICPGTVQTPSLDARIDAFDDPVSARKRFIARQPVGRLGRPEEIAALAVYLASDESAFTTGGTFNIDGGISI